MTQPAGEQPRRLLMFTPGHHEPGGAARRSHLFAAALASRGWDVMVVARAGTLRRPVLTRAPNLFVLEVPGFNRRRLGAVLFLAAAVPLGVLRGARVRAILAIQLVSPATAGALCSLLLRRPYLAMSTTGSGLSETAYIEKASLSSVRRYLLRRASFLIAQTDAVAGDLRRMVAADRVAVLPNPVEPVGNQPLNGAPRVLFTGRLAAEKDLFTLLEAWRPIALRQADARLTLAGDGGRYRPVERELRAAVAHDRVLQSSVKFTGWVPDVGPLLSHIDVFVLPSLSEGMSNALLEACAWGRVVVASDIPANRAVVGEDYPLLFPAGDIDRLRHALELALFDESARSEALAAIARRTRVFAVQEVVTQLEELIRAAADRSRH